MGRVLTNNTGLTVAIEDTIGVLPGSPVWNTLEPNAISTFGTEISKTAREPISAARQRSKGATTDLDSSVEFDADLTLSHFEDFIEGFIFSTAVNSDLKFVGATTTGTGYTIPAATAAQAAKLQYTAGGPISLIYARSYATTANNGLKPIGANVVAAATTILASGLSAETAPTNAQVDIAGIRPEIGDLGLAVSGVVGTLTSGNNGAINNIDFTTLGLTVGQSIHIGGLLAANQFSAGTGYARITSIAAGTLLLDKLDATLLTDTGAGETVDLLFGKFIRNVPSSHADFLSRSFQFEAAFPGLGAGNTDMWQYSVGNYCNQLAIGMSLSDKSSFKPSFVGTDTENPTATQKTNASTPISPNATSAYNTVDDIGRLRITDVDETGLTTCFKDMTITFNNNVSPEKCIGTLGATFVNYGNFDVNIDTSILFTNSLVIDRIRDNTTVTMDFKLKNDDGTIYIDIPSMTLGGGGRDFPVNESVSISLSAEAFGDATLGTSLGISLFPVTP